jgi:hypothetical protein
MACTLDLTGPDLRAKENSLINVLVIGNNYFLEQAAVSTTDAAGNTVNTDVSGNIDATKKKVFFNVLEGTNTVVLTFLPPPAPETLDILEDCGGGVTQPILSFGAATRAGANFKIIAS